MKRNISPTAIEQTKLNVYLGCVVPILSYASQVWYPSKSDMNEIERLQRRESTWILGTRVLSYKDRLFALKLLPRSMYFELHDLLCMMSVIEGKCSIDTCKVLSIATSSRTRQTAVNEFIIPKTRLKRCDENFWVRAAVLFNFMRRHLIKRNETLMNKKTITTVYWDYFRNSFNENVMCTWRFHCHCGDCNIHSKLTNLCQFGK